jgi:hypothetical protein
MDAAEVRAIETRGRFVQGGISNGLPARLANGLAASSFVTVAVDVAAVRVMVTIVW